MAIVTHQKILWNPEHPIDGIDAVEQVNCPPETVAEIRKLREKFGKDVIFLGHHYQRDEIIQFADTRGDSLALSQYAAKVADAKYVVFLGVHFMAETADMLTNDDVIVILPDKRAGCTMADMADIDDIEDAWEQLADHFDTEKIIPVTYINSTAAVKAFVGKHGGTICTSSNAEKIIRWAMEKGEKLFFFPDQHLGRNTSYDLGVKLDEMVVWDPEEKMGGNELEAVKQAKVLLWKGHCSVHQHFQPDHADTWRDREPGINIIVHPECNFDVVQKADYAGSTSYIINTIKNAPCGTKWAVGTENNLVFRLAEQMKAEGKEVFSLAPYACMCSTMFRISPEALLESLRALDKGEFRWKVSVDPETTELANLALKRMFDITNR